MANYNKITDFSIKDSLPSGNINKRVRGTELDAEFNAISAAISAVKQSLYPVGTVYISAGSVTNPSTLLGFGTWTQFGQGQVLVGFDISNPLYDSLEEQGTINASVSNTPVPGQANYITVFMWKRVS